MAALVTGAGQRLGQAIAVALAEAGHDVAVHYASSDKGAQATAEAVRATGRTAVTLQADLLNQDEIESLVPRAVDALGQPLSVLINNASIFEHDTLFNATSDNWDRHIGSNLRAPFFLTQAFANQAPEPETDARGEPQARAMVVNMIDMRVRKLTPGYMTYTIAKMGLWAFTQTAAQAMGPKVRINGIGPGPTLIAKDQPEDDYARSRARTILSRGSNPEDITGAVLYLLNAPAITGQLLCVDGGQHLVWQTRDALDEV